MPSDPATLISAFAAIYGGIALYILHLERRAKRLERRLVALEATTANRKAPDGKAPPSP